MFILSFSCAGDEVEDYYPRATFCGVYPTVESAFDRLRRVTHEEREVKRSEGEEEEDLKILMPIPTELGDLKKETSSTWFWGFDDYADSGAGFTITEWDGVRFVHLL